MFTVDEKIKTTIEYKHIISIIEKMKVSGALWLGRGQCISMSEMIRMALESVNIKSRLVECQLTIVNNNLTPPAIDHIGFDEIRNPGEIDTHVVVVTETTPPMLIDGSISHRLPENYNVVVDSIDKLDNNIICRSSMNNITLVYQQKKSQKISWEVQNSIIDRIETDKKIFNSLKYLKTFLVVALVVSTLNAVRGFYDFYQVHFLADNGWGPGALSEVNERLENLEELVKLPVEKRKTK
jgi:hypothetical protein